MKKVETVGGCSSSQSPAPLHTHAAPLSATTAHSAGASSSASLSGKSLLSRAEVGKQILGVSERKAFDVLRELGVVPVVLGPRCVKFLRTEVEAAVANLPRVALPTEPHQLLRSRIQRMKTGGSATATVTGA